MEKDHAKCTDCNLCLVHCQGADNPQGGVKWRQDECHMCMNCETACPEDVIKFKLLPGRTSVAPAFDLNRRTTLAAVATGAAMIPASRIADVIDANYDHRVIRPPGSVEEREFLERCIRCAECMKVCPTNALHPAWFEAGIEGLWTPILVPRIGYCQHSCVLCGQVCPTGAIQKITEKQKLGIDQKPISIGTAFFDHGRCLPWSMGTPCIVCEEFARRRRRRLVEPIDVPKRSQTPGPDGEEPPMTMVTEAALRRPGPLHRLRRLREGLPGAGQARRLRDERGRDALEVEHHLAREHELHAGLSSAQEERKRAAAPMRFEREPIGRTATLRNLRGAKPGC
jgi:ferredoxin